MEYLEIGQIVNTQGLKGEVRIYPYTDDITRFDKLKKIYVEVNNEKFRLDIDNVRYYKNLVVAKFNGIDTIEQVLKYKGKYIFIDEDDKLELPEGTYYIYDLLNCIVFDNSTAKEIGKVVDVYSTKSNDIYVVKQPNGNDILIPSIKEVILDIDIKSKKIIINKLEGLI